MKEEVHWTTARDHLKLATRFAGKPRMKPDTEDRAHEWAVLQNNIEQFERHALIVKLLAVVLATQLTLFGSAWLAVVAVGILWLQEAIFRTSQARLGERILRLESDPDAAAHRLHTEWEAQRPGTVGLIVEYLRQALRPTVAFPYPVLVVVIVAWTLLT